MGLGLPDVVGAVVLGMVLVGAAVSAVVFFLRLNCVRIAMILTIWRNY